MKLLLDTHVILWWWTDPGRLSKRVFEALSAPETEILASAVSAYEMAWKHRLGKLTLPPGMLEGFEDAIAAERWQPLSITVEQSLLAGQLESPHRDPFDRLLAAQSISEKAGFATADPAMESFEGLSVFW